MIIKLQIDLLSAIPHREAPYELLMSEAQAKELLDLLTMSIESTDTSLQNLRIKFFEEEGYMESDEYILNYYKDFT